MVMNEAALRTAEDYLRRRLEAELSMVEAVGGLLRLGARRICDVLERYAVNVEMLIGDMIPKAARKEIDAIIEELIEELFEDALLLASDGSEDNGWFVIFFGLEYENGFTFGGRLEMYARRFRDQVKMCFAAVVLAGITGGTARSDAVAGMLGDVYNAPAVVAARKHNAAFFSADGIGRGVPLSMVKAIASLTRQEIASAWMHHDYEERKAEGARGYYVVRGSSYPCPDCDGEAAVFHPIDEGMVLPEHANCCCMAVWV